MSFGGSSYQQASPMELEQAQTALQDFNDYRTNSLPAEQKMIGRSVNRQSRDSLRLGINAGTAAQQIDPAIGQRNTTMMAQGVNPNSGAFMAANNGESRLGIGGAVAGGTVRNKATYLQGLYNTVKGGRSLIDGSTAGFNSLAGMDASQRQSDASYNNAITQAYGDAAGTIAGGAFQGYMNSKASTGVKGQRVTTNPATNEFGLSLPKMKQPGSQYFANTPTMRGGSLYDLSALGVN